MKNVFIKPETTKAIYKSIDMFKSNWFKFNNPDWEQNMNAMMIASFKNAHPPSIVKAAGHAILEIDSDYPPSQGKIIKTMREYLGSGQARTPTPDACNKCNDGLRLIVFWELCTKSGIHKNIQVWQACSHCEYGTKRQKTLKIRKEYDFVDLVSDKNKNLVRNRGIWLQQKTDEQPPLAVTEINKTNWYKVHKKGTVKNRQLQNILNAIKERLIKEKEEQYALATPPQPEDIATPPQPEEDVVEPSLATPPQPEEDVVEPSLEEDVVEPSLAQPSNDDEEKYAYIYRKAKEDEYIKLDNWWL